MTDLTVTLAGMTLKNPVVVASGTFGFGHEYGEFYDLSELGGICVKGLTPRRREGNPAPRIAETPMGILNSVGLQNPGVDEFIRAELPYLKQFDTRIIANISGDTPEEYGVMCEKLSAAGVDMIEVNISCPNVKAGGIAYGVKAESAREVVSRVRACTKKPLIVKLSPNAENITEMALACEAAGADGLSLVNTFQAMAIDLEKRRPVFNNVFGGLSGPAIRPIALRMVYQVCRAVQVPVVGLGGIATAGDALEFIMAGAAAVQVGTANFSDPRACEKITDGIAAWMQGHGVRSLAEIRGCAQV